MIVTFYPSEIRKTFGPFESLFTKSEISEALPLNRQVSKPSKSTLFARDVQKNAISITADSVEKKTDRKRLKKNRPLV